MITECEVQKKSSRLNGCSGGEGDRVEKVMLSSLNWKLCYKRVKLLVDMKLQIDEELLRLPKCNVEKVDAIYKAIDEALKDEVASL